MVPTLLTFLSLGTAFWSNGQSECQCINPWRFGPYQLEVNSHAPAVPRPGCNMTRADGACFSDAYGSLGCQAYDATETFECTSAGERAPVWCQDAWCYVDEDACARPHDETHLFQNATLGPAERPQRLTYSYETCGYHNRHTEVTGDAMRIRKVLASRPGGKLRVSFPTGDSSSGYTIVGAKTYADGSLKVPINGGVGGSNRSGAVPVFIDRLLAKAGLPWEEVPVSARSKEFSPRSSFTACVHEVAIGNTDMCWGNFWPTGSRRLLTSFAGAIYADNFFIITTRNATEDSSGSRTSYLTKAFDPFTPRLWLVTVLVLGYAGVALKYEAEVKEAVEEAAETGRKETRQQRCCAFVRGAPQAFIQGVNAFNAADVIGIETKTLAGWLNLLAIGFTCTVLTTGYTAVVTATLMTNVAVGIKDLDDGIAKGQRFCVNEDLREVLVGRYPKLQSLIIGTSSKGMLPGMDSGICEAAIVQEDHWFSMRMKDSSHCSNKARLKETIAMVINTIPVNNDLAPSISHLIAVETEAGRYAPLVDQARFNYTSGVCAEASLEQETAVFDLPDMAGPLVFLGVVVTFSLFFNAVVGHIHLKGVELVTSLDKDHSGDITLSEVKDYAKESMSSVRRRSQQLSRRMSRSMPHAEVDAHGNAGVSAGSSTWMVDEFKAAQRFNEHLIAELRHLKEHLGIPQKSPMGSATPGSASAAGAPAPALPLAIPLD